MEQESNTTNADLALQPAPEVTLEESKKENLAEGIDPGMLVLILQQAKDDYKSYKNWKKKIGAKFMFGSDKQKWIQTRVVELLGAYQTYLKNKPKEEKI